MLISTKTTFRKGEGVNDVGSSRHYLTRSVEASLQRLGTDYIDLLQLHGFDALTPVEEVLTTLDTLVRAGKVRYVGVLEFLRLASDEVAWRSSDRYGYPRYVAHQAYYSLIGRDYEWELMPLGLDQGVGAVVWSPLGWGRLTGKVRRGAAAAGREPSARDLGDADRRWPTSTFIRVVDALDAVAKETGKTIPQVALNWLLQRPTVSTVVLGARNEAAAARQPRRRRLASHARSGCGARRRQRPSRSPIPTGISGLSRNGTRRLCESRLVGRWRYHRRPQWLNGHDNISFSILACPVRSAR